MILDDEKLIEINNKLTILQRDRYSIEYNKKLKIKLTRKESLLFFLFFGCFSVLSYFLSAFIFTSIDLNLANNVNFNLSNYLFLGAATSAFSFCVLFLYFLECNKKCFNKTFSSLFTFFSFIFETIISTSVFVFFSGPLLFIVIKTFSSFKSSSMSFNSFHNIFFFTILAFFIIVYMLHFFKDLFKNQQEQSKFVEDKRQFFKSSLTTTNEQILNFRNEVINSVSSVEELAYLSFVAKSENLKELLKIIDTIEKNIVKKDGYDSLLDYEKNIVFNNIQKNKTLIKNN